MFEFLILILGSLVLCSGLMVGVWFFAKKIDNYSVVDIAWSFSFLMVALYFCSVGQGWIGRRWMMVAAVGFWSVRLFSFLAKRIADHHPKEDARYQDFRQEFGANLKARFFRFYQAQALSVVILTVPFALMSLNPSPELTGLEVFGFAFSILSLVGEGIADHQKKAFKLIPGNGSKNCEVGLWRYSRHPNYFFESMLWFGFYFMACSSPYAVFTFYCPMIMLYLLLKVTGIPLSEKNSLRIHGDAYRDYQKRTSIFIPLPPSKTP